MNILVIGGAGYLGSVLVPRLVAAGHRVVVLDNAPDARERVREQLLSTDVVTDFWHWMLTDIQAIIHLAAMRLEECEANPAEAFRVNTEGTRRVLQSAEAAGVKRFIFASTCSNYGITDGIATEDTPLSPTTVYAMTKTYAEEFVRHSSIGIVLRFGTLYGPSPNMRYDTLINKLAREIARPDGMFILHDPDSWRPFLHVEDAVAAIEKMLADPIFGPAVHNVYNVAGEDAQKRHLYEWVQHYYPDFNIRLAEGKDARSYRVVSLRFHRECYYHPEHRIYFTLPKLVEYIREAEHEKTTR